jgi:1-acyl-sn-glycerol-3-phosphate acyltransferase
MVYSILRLIALVLCKIFFRLDVVGVEHIPKKGAFILVSNHVSFLDPIALGVACPRKLNYMGRHDLFRNPIFSRLLTACCTFPVKRDSADPGAFKKAIRLIKDGKALVLFPEGRRSHYNDASSMPEPGIGFLYSKLEVTVIPAFIKGSHLALPKAAHFIRPAKISVCFGRQISIERRMPYQDIAIKIMDNIRHLSC